VSASAHARSQRAAATASKKAALASAAAGRAAEDAQLGSLRDSLLSELAGDQWRVVLARGYQAPRNALRVEPGAQSVAQHLLECERTHGLAQLPHSRLVELCAALQAALAGEPPKLAAPIAAKLRAMLARASK